MNCYQQTVILIIRERDGDACSVCGDSLDLDAKIRSSLATTVHHLLPKSHPNRDRIENMRLAHHGCNAAEWLYASWKKPAFRALVIPKISAARKALGSPSLRGKLLTSEHRAHISESRREGIERRLEV